MFSTKAEFNAADIMMLQRKAFPIPRKVFSFIMLWILMFFPTQETEPVRATYQAPLTAAPISTKNFTKPIVKQIASSTGLPDVLFVSLQSPDLVWLPPRFSFDGGITWRDVATTPWSGVSDLSLEIAISPRSDPSAPVRYLVAVSGYEQIGPAFGSKLGIYRSGDNGQSWGRETNPWEFIPCMYFWRYVYRGFTPSSIVPEHLFVSYGGGALIQCFGEEQRMFQWTGFRVSFDAGVTWNKTDNIYQVIPSPRIPDRLYGRNSTGFLESDDNGQNWAPKNFPVSELVLDSRDPAWLYGFDQDRIGKRSRDGGDSWSQWSEQPCGVDSQQLIAHPTTTRILLLRCKQGLYRSRNGGNSWEQLSPISGQTIAPDYGNPGRILWARDDGLWASDNEGTTWRRLTGSIIPYLLFLPFTN